MKPTTLRTVEGMIFHLNQIPLPQASYEELWDELNKHISFSNQEVTMAMFIPSKDGKPLDDPYQEKYNWGSEIDIANYKEAKKAVIFDGFKKVDEHTVQSEHWEIVFGDGRVFISKTSRKSQFLVDGIGYTIKKLAEHTVDNPIKLKVSKDED